jgi:hypothetical protein
MKARVYGLFKAKHTDTRTEYNSFIHLGYIMRGFLLHNPHKDSVDCKYPLSRGVSPLALNDTTEYCLW